MNLNKKIIPLLLVVISIVLLRLQVELIVPIILAAVSMSWFFVTNVEYVITKKIASAYLASLLLVYIFSVLVPDDLKPILKFMLMYVIGCITVCVLLYLSTRNLVSDMQR